MPRFRNDVLPNDDYIPQESIAKSDNQRRIASEDKMPELSRIDPFKRSLSRSSKNDLDYQSNGDYNRSINSPFSNYDDRRAEDRPGQMVNPMNEQRISRIKTLLSKPPRDVSTRNNQVTLGASGHDTPNLGNMASEPDIASLRVSRTRSQ